MTKIFKNLILLTAIFTGFSLHAQTFTSIFSNGTSISAFGNVHLSTDNIKINNGSVLNTRNSFCTANSITASNSGKIVYTNSSIVSKSISSPIDLNVKFDKESIVLFSLPFDVAKENINGFNGLVLKQYTGKFNDWKYVSGNTVKKGGYSIQNYNDELNTTISGELVYTNTQKLDFIDKWELIENPFLATFDLNVLDPNNSEIYGIESTYYFWNGTNYLYFNPNAQDKFSGLTDLGKTDALLLPLQTCFVRTSKKNANVNLDAKKLTHLKTKTNMKGGSDYSEFQYLKISANGNEISDPTVVLFYENAEDNADGTYDAWKMISPANGVPQIFTSSPDGADLAVNVMKNYKPDMQIPLNFTSNKDGKYSINLEGSSRLDNIFIYDSKTGETYDLTAQQSFSFGYNTSDNVNRFTLFFEKNGVSGITNEISNQNKFNIYAFDKTVNVVTGNLENRQVQVSIYDAIGRLVVSEKMTNEHSKFQADFRQASYFVKINENGKAFTKQVIIN